MKFPRIAGQFSDSKTAHFAAFFGNRGSADRDPLPRSLVHHFTVRPRNLPILVNGAAQIANLMFLQTSRSSSEQFAHLSWMPFFEMRIVEIKPTARRPERAIPHQPAFRLKQRYEMNLLSLGKRHLVIGLTTNQIHRQEP